VLLHAIKCYYMLLCVVMRYYVVLSVIRCY